MEIINIYCDESCHLEHDKSNIMTIGSVWCEKNNVYEISNTIKGIKKKHGINDLAELKWTKISKSNINLYKDIINFFFDSDNIKFRGIIADKENLDHNRFNQTHDEWYYKMYFEMLKIIFKRDYIYNIYIDIKDVYSYKKCQKLLEVCSNNMWDFNQNLIKKIQPIRSNESQLLQIADVIIGALCYRNRKFSKTHIYSESKREIVDLISKRSGYSLNKSSYYTDEKFNFLVWEPRL